jgi:hypothetical protein
VFDLPSALSEVTDSRSQPQIPTIEIVNSVLVMCLGRLGSLNSLEQLMKRSNWLREYLHGLSPSADTVGRVLNLAETVTLRQVILWYHLFILLFPAALHGDAFNAKYEGFRYRLRG